MGTFASSVFSRLVARDGRHELRIGPNADVVAEARLLAYLLVKRGVRVVALGERLDGEVTIVATHDAGAGAGGESRVDVFGLTNDTLRALGARRDNRDQRRI